MPWKAVLIAFTIALLLPVFSQAQRTDERGREKEGQTSEKGNAGMDKAGSQNGQLDKYGVDDGSAPPAKAPAPVPTPAPAVATKPTPAAPKTVEEEKPAFLGVHYEISRTTTTGSYVTSVEPNTPAAKVGIRSGDIITKADGKPLLVLDDLVRVISTKNAGDKVVLTINRAGRIFTVSPELAVRDRDLMTYQIGSPDAGGFTLPNGNIVWIEDGLSTNRPFFGATFRHEETVLSIDDKEISKTTPRNTLTVADVVEGSTAKLLGLRPGDVVTAVNGRAVSNVEALADLLQGMQVGQDIRVTYLRAGKPLNTAGQLKPRPMTNPGLGLRPMDRPTIGGPSTPDLAAPEDDFSMDRMVNRMRAMAAEAKSEPVVTIIEEPITPNEASSLNKRAGVNYRSENNLPVNGFRVLPSGSESMYVVEFDLPTRSDTQIQVINADGDSIYNERLSAFTGHYKKGFTLPQNASGAYYVQILQGTKSFARKVTLK